MAAREVVALDESVPSLDVPQAGDTYHMPRDVTFGGNAGDTTAWTPSFQFATMGDAVFTPSVQIGTRMKIGSTAFYSFYLSGTITHTTASGLASITGLSEAPSEASPCCISEFTGLTLTGGQTTIGGRVPAAATTVTLKKSGSGLTTANITTADIPTGGTLTLAGFFMVQV